MPAATSTLTLYTTDEDLHWMDPAVIDQHARTEHASTKTPGPAACKMLACMYRKRQQQGQEGGGAQRAGSHQGGFTGHAPLQSPCSPALVPQGEQLVRSRQRMEVRAHVCQACSYCIVVIRMPRCIFPRSVLATC